MPLPDRDLALCRRALQGGSRSFFAASLLLPRHLRDDASALYAFCREADDAIDHSAQPAAALDALRQRLEAVYAGRPRSAADRAFSRVVRTHHLPRALPEALLEGFAWDAAGRQYHTLDEVLAYATRVAGSVGVMMAVLMGRRDPDTLARAADLGVAMQLTNIARDVGEDARAGRLYLPRTWLHRAGIPPREFLADPAHSAELATVVQRLLRVAARLYRRADSGIAVLPVRSRPGIYAARLLYAGIGDTLRRRGGDAVSGRTVVAPAAKLGLLSRVAGVAVLSQRRLAAPPLAATRFLVDAVPPLPPALRARGATASPGQKAAWVLELFAELELRERRARLPANTPQG